MNRTEKLNPEIKPTDLKGILRYVPQFRDHTFVISIDGSIIEDKNLQNLITDIAVLQSLRIRVVIVHGIGAPLKRFADNQQLSLSNIYGDGPTDDSTLEIALQVSAQISQKVMSALSRENLTCVLSNCIEATELGIRGGVCQKNLGRVKKVCTSFIQTLVKMDCIPVIAPIAQNSEGTPFRISSDSLAQSVAVSLKASKLIFLTPHPGLLIDGVAQRNIPMEAVQQCLEKAQSPLDARLNSKAEQAVLALQNGVTRAHILDGRVFDGLLMEIFDKVGIGTMIHANDYQQIRSANQTDVAGIFALIQKAIHQETLRPHSLESISKQIDHFYVNEIDGSLVACAALFPTDQKKVFEIGSVFVHPFYENQGIGRKLVAFCEHESRKMGARKLIALTTQSAFYFEKRCHFIPMNPQLLPPDRLLQYQQDQRNSKVLFKDISK